MSYTPERLANLVERYLQHEARNTRRLDQDRRGSFEGETGMTTDFYPVPGNPNICANCGRTRYEHAFFMFCPPAKEEALKEKPE